MYDIKIELEELEELEDEEINKLLKEIVEDNIIMLKELS